MNELCARMVYAQRPEVEPPRLVSCSSAEWLINRSMTGSVELIIADGALQSGLNQGYMTVVAVVRVAREKWFVL